MRPLLTAVLLLAGISAPISAAIAGPFGLEQGMTADQLPNNRQISPGTFLLRNVPNPHPAFETYGVVLGPLSGLCRISATSPTFENDRYGTHARDAFQKVRAQLDQNYGPSTMYDVLQPGAIYKEASEWVPAIRHNERGYQAAWNPPPGQTEIKEGIRDILLTMRAESLSDSMFTLQYRFTNHDECEKELDALASGAL